MTQRRAFHYAPLPGTERPERALFVKRWGTLLQPPSSGDWPTFTPELLTAGAQNALFRAAQAGWQIYLIGNEDEVARGRVSDQQWETFQADLLDYMAAQGVCVTHCYAALDHPEGKGAHRRKSVFLLPDTGIFFHANQHYSVELRESWVIGDATPELAAGERAGCHVARVLEPAGSSDPELHVDPELRATTLAEALDSLTQALLQYRH